MNGKVNLTAEFFSPVTPQDISAQSLQFSYVGLTASSSDGQQHSVSVYMDVSGGKRVKRRRPFHCGLTVGEEWAGGDLSKILNWDFGTSNGVLYRTFNREQAGAVCRRLWRWPAGATGTLLLIRPRA